MSHAPSQPAGNFYDKYRTRNPIARWLMSGFLSAFEELALQQPERQAVEIGCGEAELSIHLSRLGFAMSGFDISSEVIQEARQRVASAALEIPLGVSSIEELAASDLKAPLIVCCEVLEHLQNPTAAVDQLAELACPWLLASVPREPIWRALNLCRGRYVSDWGNTPGHLNHWSRGQFIRLLARRFEIVEMRAPLPWTMVLCRVQ